MHTQPDQRLLEFIRKFRVDLTAEGTITRLELYHSIEGSTGERLATFEMADRDDDEDPDDLAQEIWDEAEEDASTRPTGSVERYVIQAFRGDTREPDEQKAFTTRGKLVNALTGNSSEPPTERGMIMAENRRTNDLHALVVRMCEATAGSAAIQLQREREENNRLREVAFEYEKLRQQLLDRSVDRELQREEAKASQSQNQMLIGTLIQLAPIVLSRLLAAPAPPGSAMPLAPAPVAAPAQAAGQTPPQATVSEPVLVRDSILGSLLESVSLEQMQSMIGLFTAEQKQKFLAAYTSYREHPPVPVTAAHPPAN
jgi:hypothetical protein